MVPKLNSELERWELTLQTTLPIPATFTTAISKFKKRKYKTQLLEKFTPCYSQSTELCPLQHCDAHLPQSNPSTSNSAIPQQQPNSSDVHRTQAKGSFSQQSHIHSTHLHRKYWFFPSSSKDLGLCCPTYKKQRDLNNKSQHIHKNKNAKPQHRCFSKMISLDELLDYKADRRQVILQISHLMQNRLPVPPVSCDGTQKVHHGKSSYVLNLHQNKVAFLSGWGLSCLFSLISFRGFFIFSPIFFLSTSADAKPFLLVLMLSFPQPYFYRVWALEFSLITKELSTQLP